MWRTNFLPAGLRGRVIFGKGNGMEELIKRLERVIQTGAPDKDGQHPISAEVVLEVVKEQLSTNLASLGTDCISRQAAIDVVMECYDNDELFEVYEWKLNELPPIQPEIIHCKDCRKHNKKLGFDENYNITYRDDACPLIPWRGMSKGHEHDYQSCCLGEKREVTT